MVVNDNAGGLTPRGVLGYIASKLAPTGVPRQIIRFMANFATINAGFATQSLRPRRVTE